jgi:NDP-sugar pyrophosphorylase family protein
MQAVILAGGKGTRLKPFTTSIPKPLVPVDDLPVLEIVLRQLKSQGFTDIVITVNHLSELIMAFFGNGEKLGLNIVYSKEDLPLGTAGPLSLIENLDDNFLVMNGDLLTTLNYQELYAFHRDQNADLSIPVYQKDVKIDLGVLEIEQGQLVNYIEKPTYSFMVSMGVYVFSRDLLNKIPTNEKLDMPDFIESIKTSANIQCFTGDYYWLDIGRAEDYETANQVFKERRADFLPES